MSIVSSVASGAEPVEHGRVKVPTPGPYSTNSLVFAQSTGLEHLVDQDSARRNDRADHHGILEKAAQELPVRARRAAVAAALKARGPFSVRADEVGMNAPSGQEGGGALANAPPLGKVPNDELLLTARHSERVLIATKTVSLRAALTA